MPPTQEPQNPLPVTPTTTPIVQPVVLKMEHSAWFYVLMTILTIVGIAIVLFIAAFAYHEVQLQQARQQLQTAEQQVQANEQQVQDTINRATPAPVTNTAPAPTTSSNGGATVNSGTQTVPNDGYPTSPTGAVTVNGTASASSVQLIFLKGSYTGAQDYNSAANVEETQTGGAIKVSNGVWSASADLSAGLHTVLVYDASNYKPISAGEITVVIK